jgi:hypothetical protein
MSNGTDIAAEIAVGLAEAGTATGSGPLSGTIKRKGAQTGPDYAPVYGPDTLHSFTVILGSFSNRERADTAILATDTKITASVSDIVPLVSDTITVQGVAYQVYGVDPLKPGGTDLMYKIWARA